MKLPTLPAPFTPAVFALMLFAAPTAALAQAAATAPPSAGANPAAAAGPAAPAAAALPHAAGPTITAAEEEAALLALIAGIQAGKPDYSALAPPVAQALRRRLAAISARAASLGPVEGVDLLGDGPRGMKRFKVRHGDKVSEWALSLDQNGRISGLSANDPAFGVRAPVARRAARKSARPPAQARPAPPSTSRTS
jgi:hypothetical protein